MFHSSPRLLSVSFSLILLVQYSLAAERLGKNLTLHAGAINGVIISQNGQRLAVYGDPRKNPDKVDTVLVTHHRRDVVWAARALVDGGAKLIVPEKERMYFEEPEKQWADFIKIRLVDAQQQTTKMIRSAFQVSRGVKEGDKLQWQGINFEVLETPGFTRDAVTYLTTLDGDRVAFTGDLIYGDGKIFDLYSFQDKIPAAKIGGYHGYGSRLAKLLKSLEKLAATKPDLIVPARGPVIRDVQKSISRLIGRVKELYRNYLSTNALYWYFKADRMKACAERILGKSAEYSLMPYSHHEDLPEWVISIGTTRVIIAEDGSAFLLDCGNKRYLDFVKGLMKEGIVSNVEGIFVTHYHGDHTHWVQRAAEEFNCPVYATVEYQDILEKPAAYHMPAGTSYAIRDVIGKKDGAVMKWHEYTFTFRFFPGQTYYHGALFVEKPDAKKIFFVGDAFTPSGMDDYCVLNRNLMHDDTGYFRCFSMIRELQESKGPFYMMNEHVPYIFSYTDGQLGFLEDSYRKRRSMLKDLVPWDDPNYGIDEQWAWFYPYGVETRGGQRVKFKFQFYNHSPQARDFRFELNLPKGFRKVGGSLSVSLAGGAQAEVPFEVQVGGDVKPGNHIITADVFSKDIELREWSEAIVTVVE
jgi:glyoxylase-like metal-dependent hydrolase (beta-lactamase superfamily II)